MCSIMKFQVAQITENAITTNLTIACDRGMLRFRVYANSTTGSDQQEEQFGYLGSMVSTQITVSGLLTSTGYNLFLQLVEPQCANSTAAILRNVITTAAPTSEFY